MQNTYGQDRINEQPPRKLSIRQLFNKIWDFVLPYKFMVLATLLLTLVGSLLAQVNAYILRYTVDELSSLVESHKTLNEGLSMLFLISGVLLAKELVYAAIQFGQKFYGEKLKILISRDFSGTIVERILSYRMAFYTATENESGKLQSRIDLGISSLTGLVRNFFIDILPLFANAFIALVIIFVANFWVGLVSLAILPVYYWVSVVQANRLSGYRRRMRYYRESRSNAIIGLIDSIPVIKSFTRESLEAEKHEKIQYEITENQLKTRRISFLFDSVKSFLEQVGVVFIIILTAYFVLKGDMSIGMILFHILLFNNVSAPIRQLHRIYDEINDALVYSEAFFNILDAEDEIENSGSIIPENITGNIEMNDVDFRYPNGTTALKEVSIHIPANKITALVGLSGAGKSTVVNLLDKFYKPTRGKITLDGTDLEEYDTARLRDQIGLVMQENHIFKGSITENILYGNQQATHEEVVEAAKKAHIHQEIMELPLGYDSNANQLSGGQKQRISIARLFLKDPPIIFLDEPTASLDAVATEQIKKSLDAIKKDRTVIIISHSISQIIDADNVVVLDHGRVVEKGPHEALYKNEAAYYDIFQAAANSLNLEKISDTLNE